MRPLNHPERKPYWKRNVRPDFLHVKFDDFKLNLISGVYDIIAREIKLYYNESEKHNPIYFAKASFYENTSSKYYPASVEYPRIIIQIPNDQQLSDMNEEFIREHKSKKDDSDSDQNASFESIKIKIDKIESTPFSKKQVYRKSETSHNKGDAGKIKFVHYDLKY